MTVGSSIPVSKHDLLFELTTGLDDKALTWLSGYFAGLADGRAGVQTHAAAPVISAVAAAPAPEPALQATVLYGSQTGNAKRVAEKLAEDLEAGGVPVRLLRADRYPTKELKDERLLFVVM